MVAGSECIASFLAYLAAVSDLVGFDLPVHLLTDSAAAETNYKTGYSRKLRYMRKNQRTSLAFTSDAIAQVCMEVGRVESGRNNSVVHTKALERVPFTRHRDAMSVRVCV